jgi:hypothetical protein
MKRVRVAVVVLGMALCLSFVTVSRTMAIPVSPGGLAIQGQMYVEGDNDPLQWRAMVYDADPWTWDQPGDPLDLMYTTPNSEMGVRAGVYDVLLGSYERAGIVMLGHVIHAMDFTVQANDIGVWPDSGNLRFEVRHFSSDTVYWSTTGPFSSEPVQGHIDFADPVAGYELRLTVVPEPVPLVALSSGLALLMLTRKPGRKRA